MTDAIKETLDRLIHQERIGSVDEILYRLDEAHPDLSEAQVLAAMDMLEGRL